MITRQELTKRSAKLAGIPETTASRYLTALLGVIKDALVRGEDVSLVGIGRLRTAYLPAYNKRCLRIRTYGSMKIALNEFINSLGDEDGPDTQTNSDS
jgi:nucleoid DNA-binding protein